MAAIDLSRLPAPNVIESLDFETIFDQMLADLRQRAPEYDGLLESDPAHKILQVSAYRELLLRQRLNEAARSVMVAYAQGSDLEQLGALFGVERQVLDPGNPNATPPVPPTYEDIERFRQRIPLSLEGFSTAGPVGAYTFHAFDTSSQVKDVTVNSPAPGEVVVTVLSQDGDGTPEASLLTDVNTRLNHEDIRPLTDKVTVQGATIKPYQIDADLIFFRGPDHSLIVDQVRERVADYVKQQHKLGYDITLSGLYAALHLPGVQNVKLKSPTADITVSPTEAAYCTAINVAEGGYDE